jgi:hypothetical protein
MSEAEAGTVKPASLGRTATTNKPRATSGVVEVWGRSFYFWMSVLIAAVVVYGFSFTVGQRLIHPPSPRPAVLYAHAALFTGWLVFLMLQSALVRVRKVKVQRTLGWFGLALGATLPLVGVATAIVMSRLRIRSDANSDAAQFLIIPLWDMLAFSVSFALAFYWRTKPEVHRRLILIASCALTAAAFGRFPFPAIRDVWFYAGVDSLILLGVVRDVMVTRKIHPVYLYGLPLLLLGQITIMYVSVKGLPGWMRIAHDILGM